VLLDALVHLAKSARQVLDGVSIYFTLDKLPDNLMQLIREHKLESVVNFLGAMPYDKLLRCYKSADALLFPSKIESFGLPLVEAACFGLPVVAARLPYAEEVLETYYNKYFVDADDVQGWAAAIKNHSEYSKIAPIAADAPYENSWKAFFDLVTDI
jgi:glycosyltransferase involved in cell wall biosynthesis